jgi:phosphoserine phosphatase RsbU/P
MAERSAPSGSLLPFALLVVEPSGARTRVALDPLPFSIGRQSGSHLVLRDARISRSHARILAESGDYFIEDLDSRNGVFVNGDRVRRRKLTASDRIEFGVPDSYSLIFTSTDAGVQRIAERFSPAPGSQLARLRAVVELARTLETSFSTTNVLAALVDTALAVTGAERGFLLLRKGAELEFRAARDRHGADLRAGDLRVPRSLIHRALTRRRELLSMTFPADSADPDAAMRTVADLELRSVVCVPLVKLGAFASDQTAELSPDAETAGLLYMDSRAGEADLSSGNRELLQTLALEASTILENARLLEGERSRQRMEEELRIARAIQESLLPRALPSTGWLRAAGHSVPSHQVGGDYFDLHPIEASTWALINADVSGKGVSSALLASLIQGVFLASAHAGVPPEQAIARLSRFFLDRTEGEKYATIFYGTLEASGILRYVNAGHCPPLLVRAGGGIQRLAASGLPAGMLEEAEYEARAVTLQRGDMLVLYTDGLTEAEDPDGRIFGEGGLLEVVRANAAHGCRALHEALDRAVTRFTQGAVQKDDMTLMVVEYSPEEH